MNGNTGLYANLHELIVSDYLRVEKSQNFFELLRSMELTPNLSSPNVFLMIRPRGFGLSLSTEALYTLLERAGEFAESTASRLDQRTLSELERLPRHHVISINLKKVASKTPREFSDQMISKLQELYWEHHLNGQITSFTTPKTYFAGLIDQLSERHKDQIVILIDNYDIPLIMASFMEPRYRQQAVSVYLEMLNVIRHSQGKVRWALLSGHVKFSMASELSEGLPLVRDLSSAPEYDTLFGFTREETAALFKREIAQRCEQSHQSEDEVLDALERCYGGFCFSDRLRPVLCPACINHVITNGFKLLPYSCTGDYAFLRQALAREGADFGWLFGKDGQDPLFGNSLPLEPRGKQLGSLLIQLGFATRSRVTEHDLGGFSTWRYRFSSPNLDMSESLRLISDGEEPSATLPDLQELLNAAEEAQKKEPAAAKAAERKTDGDEAAKAQPEP